MSFEYVALGPDELEVARLLAGHESVCIRLPRERAAEARALGFIEMVPMFDCFVRAPFDAGRLSHRHRNLDRAVKAWHRLKLRVELRRFGELGFERFIDEVYQPLLLPALYGKGIAPHETHTLAGVRKLLDERSVVALVFRGPQLVGAAVLREGDGLERAAVVRGQAPVGPHFEGMVYALAPELGEVRRALMVGLAAAAAQAGHRWFSVGRDLGWCDLGYERVLVEKLALADTVLARFEAHAFMLSVTPRAHERFTVFEWAGGGVVVHRFGGESEPVARMSELLRADRGP